MAQFSCAQTGVLNLIKGLGYKSERLRDNAWNKREKNLQLKARSFQDGDNKTLSGSKAYTCIY